ncbi:hypothetical protein BKA16_000556 [Gordonia humi]|uniref:Uncharacterized protein n=2 Tax=Gordonia humi TaxID=686429 RepID=A0A840EUI8_9ACTN|nr:hypothetical protein [Gordonia humi]MBB4134004.1 hypothetical protein [Gordonia humi]
MTAEQSEGWWNDHVSVMGRRGVRRRQVDAWQSRAHTPGTRAQIRRWARWETVSIWLLLGGLVAVCVCAPGLGMGFGIWGEFDDRAPSWMWGTFGSVGVGCALLLCGAALGSHAQDRRLTALYADGHACIGRLDEVITHPGGGDDPTTYEFLLSAELSGTDDTEPRTLRRRLYWGEDDSWGAGPERWIGRRIRFRHNTLDPDDLFDVRFDGWAGDKTRRS